MTYRETLAAAWDTGTLAETSPPSLPPELELQALWYAGAFGRDFTDTDGNTVRIVQFGEWNRSAGPDFLNAVIELHGIRREGSLELDPHPDDWEIHGHGSDPAYEKTVLHVVFSADPGPPSFTRTLGHRKVPRVVVPRPLLDEALQLPRRQIAIARPGRCVRPLSGLPTVSVGRLLEDASVHRASLKSARFLRTADAHGRDAALWQAVAETLGYRSNALPMRLLAQRLPLPALREAPDQAEALLFGCAGFLAPDLHEKAPDDTRDRLRRLWDDWWKARGFWESSHPLPWKWSGQRPANHPHRRVAALAALARVWPRFRRLALARPFAPAAVLKFLSSVEDPFWTHRHTLASSAKARPVALFGKSQAIELLANHLFPVAVHEGEPLDPYLKLAAGALNEKVRRCAIRLFGDESRAAPWLKKAAHQQALLQIYHDFCLEDSSDCEQCPFPLQLGQWRADETHTPASPSS